MKAKLPQTRWNLIAGEPVSLAGAADWTITLDSGKAWLTLEGYSQDKLLGAGERFRLPDGGRVVVESDRASRLRLDPPAAAASAPWLDALRRTAGRLAESLTDLTLKAPEGRRCPSAD